MSENRIVQAVMTMLSNKKNILEVAGDGNEFYFLYKKYVWSISPTINDHFSLCFYPHASSPFNLFDGDGVFISDTIFIAYDTQEFGTPEAKKAFKNLHLLARDIYFKSDEVLDDIISDGLSEE